MTWKEFKNFVELHGVLDDDPIDFIDIANRGNDITVEKGVDVYGWQISS